MRRFSSGSRRKRTDALRHSRLYVTVGDGTPAAGQINPAGGVVEAGLKPQSEELAGAAEESGVDVKAGRYPKA